MTHEITAAEEQNSNSHIIGIRFPKNVALAIKQEAACRDIRINQLILELWENYQCDKERN